MATTMIAERDSDHRADLELVPGYECGAFHRGLEIKLAISKTSKEISKIGVIAARHLFRRPEEMDFPVGEHGDLARHSECRSYVVRDTTTLVTRAPAAASISDA